MVDLSPLHPPPFCINIGNRSLIQNMILDRLNGGRSTTRLFTTICRYGQLINQSTMNILLDLW